MAKLLPCPFCSSDDVHITNAFPRSGVAKYRSIMLNVPTRIISKNGVREKIHEKGNGRLMRANVSKRKAVRSDGDL